MSAAVAERPTTPAQVVTPTPLGEPMLVHSADNRAKFHEKFDHQPFEFHHHLHRHPLLQLPALIRAAERIAANPATAGKSHFESGTPDRNAWFGARPAGETLVGALESIESGQNWVILKRIHEDPEYRAVLDAMIPELSGLSGIDIPEVYYDPTMTIFITSPGRITPYHMDGETNFLAQIRGNKLVYIYDGNDKNVLSDEDMERYWTGNLPKIDYPESMPQGQWQYTLEPGNGVFNPAIFPHWLQNGDGVSVSVSINFKRKRNAAIGAARTNRYLRMAGVSPKAPGQSPALDRAKEATFGRLYDVAYSAAGKLRERRSK